MGQRRAKFNGLAVIATCLPALASIALSGCATPASPTDFSLLKNRLTADCKAGLFSGVVAAKEQRRTVFLHACGLTGPAGGVPLGPEARFKIFSVSKPITATAIQRLIEQGRMEIDGLLSSYIPEVPEEWAGITIRHLLQHRSGAPDLTEKLLEAYQKGARTHAAAMAYSLSRSDPAGKRILAAPGETWHYNNFGYELLAEAASRVAGAPFHEVLRELVFEPAGMKSASVELPSPKGGLTHLPSPGLVTGFFGTPGDMSPTFTYSYVQQGAGAVHASYRDLFAFDEALSRGNLLSRSSITANEEQSVRASKTVRYGFGWMIRSVGACTYWQHDGGNQGYVTDFSRAPEAGVAAVILSNFSFVKVGEYRKAIMETMLRGPKAFKRCKTVGG